MHTRRSFLRTTAGFAAIASAGGGIWVRRAIAGEPFAPPTERIAGARNVALSILKPSAREFERGLALHAESLVFDAYAFAPRAAIDGTRFNAAIQAGASEEELADLQEDMMMTRCAIEPRERREFFDAFAAAGVTCIFQNAGEESSDPLRLIKRLARFTFTTDALRGDLDKAVGVDEVLAAKQRLKHCLCFTTNGVPLRLRLESTADELRLVRIFRQLGVRMMHLTYNRRNALGDGAGESSDGGLSDFGREAIGELNRQGIIVDVAHSGWRTSREAAKASAKPMVASHTTCGGLYSHFRGKPDDTIKAICDTGGFVGICCIPRFLGRAGDISAFLDHIDYAVKKFGADYVAIGTDVAHVSRHEESERAKITRTNSPPRRTVERWEALWPKDDFLVKPHGIPSLAWTNWPLFTVGLVQRGHSDKAIRKILGGNVLRVLQANSPTPTKPL